MKIYSENQMQSIREEFESEILQRPHVAAKKMFGCPCYKVKDKLFAFLAYLGILFLIPLLAKKDNPWIYKHAKQGFIMFLAGFLVWIPLLGWLWGIFLFVCWIIEIVYVITGRYFKIPLIGDIAEKINL